MFLVDAHEEKCEGGFSGRRKPVPGRRAETRRGEPVAGGAGRARRWNSPNRGLEHVTGTSPSGTRSEGGGEAPGAFRAARKPHPGPHQPPALGPRGVTGRTDGPEGVFPNATDIKEVKKGATREGRGDKNKINRGLSPITLSEKGQNTPVTNAVTAAPEPAPAGERCLQRALRQGRLWQPRSWWHLGQRRRACDSSRLGSPQ